jgi:peroxiredoxin
MNGILRTLFSRNPQNQKQILFIKINQHRMNMLMRLFFAICLILLVAGKSAPPKGYEIGDLVDNFKLKNVDGKMISLSDYDNQKGVILIFDCNTCPYSRAYNQRIIQLNEKYSPKGFPVITINANDPNLSPGDSFAEMVNRAKSKNYTFPYLVDVSQDVARAFGATNTPHVFLLKKKGVHFVLAYSGTIDNNSRDGSRATRKYVEEAIGALLSGNEVPTTRTKALGCSIKYRST